MGRKSKNEAEVTRQQLLDAAERLFFEQGVANTSLNQIAEAAGMTRGAIYWHFKNKVELFEAMHARVALPLEQMQAQVLGQADPVAALRDYWALAIAHLMTCDHSRRVVDILLRKCEYVQEFEHAALRVHMWKNSCLEMMRLAFREAAQMNRLAPGMDPDVAAVAFHSLITGLIYTWLGQSSDLDMRPMMQGILDRFLGALTILPQAGHPQIPESGHPQIPESGRPQMQAPVVSSPSVLVASDYREACEA